MVGEAPAHVGMPIEGPTLKHHGESAAVPAPTTPLAQSGGSVYRADSLVPMVGWCTSSRWQHADPYRARIDIWSPLAAMTGLPWEEVEDWCLQLGRDRLTGQVGSKPVPYVGDRGA